MTISQAQIYPSLQQLEQAGFITGREDPQGRRRRRVFEITAAGRAELTGWLRRDDPMPFELRDTGIRCSPLSSASPSTRPWPMYALPSNAVRRLSRRPEQLRSRLGVTGPRCRR
jgi:DNA-binding PadR family transcriptional regulator